MKQRVKINERFKNNGEMVMRAFVSFLAALFLAGGTARAAEGHHAYFKATVEMNIADAAQKVKDAMETAGFSIIGEYSPGDKPTLKVIVFTSLELQDELARVKDRGLLAAALKVGLMENGGKTVVSMVNPAYLFRAYLMKEFKAHEAPLMKIDDLVKQALQVAVKQNLTPFGGDLGAKELEHYHYMVGMEYFDDPVTLKSFGSFEEGIEKIRKNLSERKGGAAPVYEIIGRAAKTAVFGVALENRETGEARFLPIIGEDHLAALPYEIILADNKATMLHGRYRIALHWPLLTMGTFTKIMSTPGDIEETMKGLTK